MNQRDKQRDKQNVPFNEKIISFLRHITPRPATPKEVAFEMGAEHERVKKSMLRLYKQGRIEKTVHGYYRALFSLDDILRGESPEMRLHGIKIEGNVPKGEQGSPLLSLLFKDGLMASGNRRMVKRNFEGRTVTIQLSESGTLEIFLRSSRYSISYIEFERFAGWLDGMFANKTLLFNLKICELGLGRDFKKWRLDGVKSIKLGQWRNAWLQIYQKEKTGIMRMEIHTIDHLSLGDAMHILKGMAENPKQLQEPPADSPSQSQPPEGMYQ